MSDFSGGNSAITESVVKLFVIKYNFLGPYDGFLLNLGIRIRRIRTF